MFKLIAHAYFTEPAELWTTDERYDALARRSATTSAVCVALHAVMYMNPWALILIPTEWGVLTYATSTPTRFSRFCATYMGFAWLVFTLGEVTYGLAYVAMAVELMWPKSGEGGNKTRISAHELLPFLLIPLWMFAPWLILFPFVPLVEKKWSLFFMRLPIYVSVMFAIYAPLLSLLNAPLAAPLLTTHPDSHQDVHQQPPASLVLRCFARGVVRPFVVLF